MDDSTDMIDPTGPSDHTDLERRLAAHFDAAMTEVDDTTPPLDEVCRRGRRLCRRRRATQMVGALGVIGALVLAVSVATGTLGGDGDELTVGPTADSPAIDSVDNSGDGTEPTDRELADGDPTDAVDGAPSSRYATTGSVVARPAVGWVSEQIAHEHWDQRLVPWGDGVARIATEWTEPILESMSDEMIALFPDEVQEFFADGLPATVNDGYEMLHGHPDLLAQVQRVIDQHPEVADHLYGGRGSASLIIETSADARVWNAAGELEMPGQDGWIQYAASTGDRIVVVVASWPDTGDTGAEHIVASTTDLTSWDTIERLDPPDSSPAPVGFRRDLWMQQADLGPDGSLAVMLSNSLELDIESLLPPDLLARTEWGYGMSSDDEGLLLSLPSQEEIERMTSMMNQPITVPTTMPASPEEWPDDDWLDDEWPDDWFDDGPAFDEEILLTWDELGVDPGVAREAAHGVGGLLWAGTPGSLRPMTPPPTASWLSGLTTTRTGGFVVASASDAGMIDVWYSSDGSNWVERRPPISDPAWFSGISRTADGIMLAVHGQDGLRWWRADDTASGWAESAPIELEDLDSALTGYIDQSSTAFRPGIGHVVGLRLETAFFSGWSIEIDGYRLEAGTGPWGSATLIRIGTDGAPDETVLELSPFGDDEFVRYTNRGMTFLDPETGDELVSIDNETLGAAFEAALNDEDGHGDPGGLLVLLIDPEGTGETWYELDRVRTGDTWLTEIVLTDDLLLLSLEGPDGPVVHTYRPS